MTNETRASDWHSDIDLPSANGNKHSDVLHSHHHADDDNLRHNLSGLVSGYRGHDLRRVFCVWNLFGREDWSTTTLWSPAGCVVGLAIMGIGFLIGQINSPEVVKPSRSIFDSVCTEYADCNSGANSKFWGFCSFENEDSKVLLIHFEVRRFTTKSPKFSESWIPFICQSRRRTQKFFGRSLHERNSNTRISSTDLG